MGTFCQFCCYFMLSSFLWNNTEEANSQPMCPSKHTYNMKIKRKILFFFLPSLIFSTVAWSINVASAWDKARRMAPAWPLIPPLRTSALKSTSFVFCRNWRGNSNWFLKMKKKSFFLSFFGESLFKRHIFKAYLAFNVWKSTK